MSATLSINSNSVRQHLGAAQNKRLWVQAFALALQQTPNADLAMMIADRAAVSMLRTQIKNHRHHRPAKPTDAQREVGNYRKDHIRWQGLDITIETAKGQTRTGKTKAGVPWSVKMTADYGYIKGTESDADGDHVDIFLGPHRESEIVFIVNQNKGPTDRFDEHKVVAGCLNEQEAKDLYHANYSKGWKGFRDIVPMTIDQFKEWLKKGDTGSPAKLIKLARKHNHAVPDLMPSVELAAGLPDYLPGDMHADAWRQAARVAAGEAVERRMSRDPVLAQQARDLERIAHGALRLAKRLGVGISLPPPQPEVIRPALPIKAQRWRPIRRERTPEPPKTDPILVKAVTGMQEAIATVAQEVKEIKSTPPPPPPTIIVEPPATPAPQSDPALQAMQANMEMLYAEMRALKEQSKAMPVPVGKDYIRNAEGMIEGERYVYPKG